MNEKQNDAMAEFWLHTATSALCDEARARIAVEIKAHYADLVKAHVTKGMELIDARLKALEDLGDAQVAARRFRKEHLTKKEERAISYAIESAKITPLAIGLFYFIFLTFVTSLDGGSKMWISVVFLAVFVGAPLTASIFARRVEGQNGVKAALLSDMAVKMTQGVFFIVYFPLMDWPPRPLFFICILTISLNCLNMAWPNYRLWKKFDRERKKRDEMIKAG